MENNHHDWRDTVQEATGTNAIEEREADRAKRRDAEIAYEGLAFAASMGMIGMEEQTAHLVQLNMAQQLAYDLAENGDIPSKGIGAIPPENEAERRD